VCGIKLGALADIGLNVLAFGFSFDLMLLPTLDETEEVDENEEIPMAIFSELASFCDTDIAEVDAAVIREELEETEEERVDVVVGGGVGFDVDVDVDDVGVGVGFDINVDDVVVVDGGVGFDVNVDDVVVVDGGGGVGVILSITVIFCVVEVEFLERFALVPKESLEGSGEEKSEAIFFSIVLLNFFKSAMAFSRLR